jgi:hypothetical protein
MPKESKRRILQHLDSEPHEKSAKRREHISTLVKIPFGVFRKPSAATTGQIINRLVSTWIPRSGHDGQAVHRAPAAVDAWPQDLVSSWVPRAHGCGQDDAGREGHRQGAGATVLTAAPGDATSVCLQGHSYTYGVHARSHCGALNAAQ